MISESLKTNIQLSKFPALISCGGDEAEQSEKSEDRIANNFGNWGDTLFSIPLRIPDKYHKEVSALRQFLSRWLISTKTIYITPNTSFLLVFVTGYHGMVAEELRGKDAAVSILTSCMDSIL